MLNLQLLRLVSPSPRIRPSASHALTRPTFSAIPGHQAFMFTGVRFVVDDEASLTFTTEAVTEFNGIFKLVSYIHTVPGPTYTHSTGSCFFNYAIRTDLPTHTVRW